MRIDEDFQELDLIDDPVIRVYLAHVDRTLIAKNIKLSVEQRFEQLSALQAFAEELRRASRDSGQK